MFSYCSFYRRRSKGPQATAGLIDASSLDIARNRCTVYNISAQFLQTDAALILDKDLSEFDLVIFWAVLEHMTHSERLSALRAAWQGLKPGAIMGVVDTPNRLWYFDDHTSNLPFFHWLPEEIALRYTARCDRDLIKDLYKLPASEGAIGLQRWGRGISYHDFELALDGLPPMKIAAAYGPHERARFLPKLIKWHVSVDYAFYKILRRIAPELDPAFCEPYLEFLAKKPN